MIIGQVNMLFLQVSMIFDKNSCELHMLTCSNDTEGAVRFFKILVLLYTDDSVILGENEHSFHPSLDNFYEYSKHGNTI
jgi:hypothetical protein